MLISEKSHFVDKHDAKSFHELGYFTINKFLSQSEIQKIKNQINLSSKAPFNIERIENNQTKDEILFDVFALKLKRHINNVKPVFRSIIEKKPSPKSEMGLHQDWSIIDEDQSFAFNVWVPLTDVNEQNGTLWLYPKSHIKYQNIRGQNIEDIFIDEYSDIVPDKLVPVNLLKGDALIMNQRLLHISYPNKGKESRIVAMVTFVPNSASLRHYIYKENFGLVEYKVSDDFYLSFDMKSEPTNGTILKIHK